MRKAFLGLIAPVLLVGAAAPPQERVVSGDGIVTVAINGAPGRMRIEPGAPGTPLITAAFAARAKLKGGGMLGFGLGYGVGPVSVHHRTSVATLDLDGVRFKRRVGWGTRAYTPVADGVIGPDDLPEPVIRFVMRAPRADEHMVALPMADIGGVFSGFFGLYAKIMVGGAPLRVRFDPWHARTLANAGAGLRLATSQDGRLSGDAVPTEIMFGIERPVRTMVMARPLPLGPLSITTIGVRTNDNGDATRIADASDPRARVDPDEIVITAKGKKRNSDLDQLSLGADQLDRCSSIVFDKPARQIRLTCR